MMNDDGSGEPSWALGDFGWMASETRSFALSDEISPKSTTSFTIETELYWYDPDWEIFLKIFGKDIYQRF